MRYWLSKKLWELSIKLSNNNNQLVPASAPRPMTANGNTQHSDSSIPRECYVFAVYASSGWKFVEIDGNYCRVNGTINQVFPIICREEMEYIWKRAVIDGAVEWDESGINDTTFRLLKLNIDIKDVTNELFEDTETLESYLKLGAIRKLSNTEAKLLNLEIERTKYIMLANSAKTPYDLKMLKRLQDKAISIIPHNIINLANG